MQVRSQTQFTGGTNQYLALDSVKSRVIFAGESVAEVRFLVGSGLITWYLTVRD
jgi:hypothetical protein